MSFSRAYLMLFELVLSDLQSALKKCKEIYSILQGNVHVFLLFADKLVSQAPARSVEDEVRELIEKYRANIASKPERVEKGKNRIS